MTSAALPADVEVAGPLIPPALLKYSVTHSGSLIQRYTSQPDSLLKWLSKPGHLFGEGYQRIYLGNCPSSSTNSSDVVGEGRSFLIGVDALWAEDAAEKRRESDERAQASHCVQPERADASTSRGKAGADSLRKHRNDDHRGQHSSHCSQSHCEHAQDTLSDGTASSSSGSSSSDSDNEHTERKPWRKRSPAGLRRMNKGKQREVADTRMNAATPSSGGSQRSSSTIGTSPDTLFQKLRGNQHRKHLSSGHSSSGDTVTRKDAKIDATLAPPVQTFLQVPQTVSPLSLATPSSSASFHSANPYFFSSSSRQPTDRSLAQTAYESVAESLAPLATSLSAFTAPLTRTSSRSTVRAIVQNQERDNVELGPTISRRSASARSERSIGVNTASPVSPDLAESGASRHLLPSQQSDAQHAKLTSANTSDAGLNAATQDLRSSALPPAPNKPPPKIHRLHSIDSEQVLSRFAATKEAAFPPGVEKLERMLVRVGKSKRAVIPDDFDEVVAKRFRIRYKPWEELAVVRKKNHLELWGTHVSLVTC